MPTSRRPAILVGVAAMALLAVGSVVGVAYLGGGSSAGAQTPAASLPPATTVAAHRISYSMTVGKTCYEIPDSGYSDIAMGAEVEVTDGHGNLLGVDLLGAGGYSSGSCEFNALVNVNASSDGFYRVTVGNINRGYLTLRETDFIDGVATQSAVLG